MLLGSCGDSRDETSLAQLETAVAQIGMGCRKAAAAAWAARKAVASAAASFAAELAVAQQLCS